MSRNQKFRDSTALFVSLDYKSAVLSLNFGSSTGRRDEGGGAIQQLGAMKGGGLGKGGKGSGGEGGE